MRVILLHVGDSGRASDQQFVHTVHAAQSVNYTLNAGRWSVHVDDVVVRRRLNCLRVTSTHTSQVRFFHSKLISR